MQKARVENHLVKRQVVLNNYAGKFVWSLDRTPDVSSFAKRMLTCRRTFNGLVKFDASVTEWPAEEDVDGNNETWTPENNN
jgi:hypothetical protein